MLPHPPTLQPLSHPSLPNKIKTTLGQKVAATQHPPTPQMLSLPPPLPAPMQNRGGGLILGQKMNITTYVKQLGLKDNTLRFSQFNAENIF